MSICTELISDRRQRAVVDGAPRDWIPIISIFRYATGKCVGFSSVYSISQQNV